jgi:hypothetical protein
MSEQLARYEDAVDRVQELIDELRADEADERPVDLTQLIERLEVAVEPS